MLYDNVSTGFVAILLSCAQVANKKSTTLKLHLPFYLYCSSVLVTAPQPSTSDTLNMRVRNLCLWRRFHQIAKLKRGDILNVLYLF